MVEFHARAIESTPGPVTAAAMRTARCERARILVVLSLGILGSLYLLVIGSELDYSPWWSAIPFLTFPVAASFKLYRTAMRQSDNDRRAWLCFSVGCILFAGAEANWTYYEVFLGDYTPSPSLGDIGYFGFSIAFMLGIWYYRIRAQPAGGALVQLGNVGIVFSAVLLAYLFPYYELIKQAANWPQALTSMVYAILNVAALLFGLVVLSLHVWGKKRRVLTMIVCGLAALVGTDFVYTYDLLNGGFKNADILNILYPVCFSLIYLASFEQGQLSGNEAGRGVDPVLTDRSLQWETLVAPFAVAYVIAMAFIFREGLSRELLPYAIGPLVLFVVSLAVRSWWGHKAEAQLRIRALASKAELQIANRDLRGEMRARSRIEGELRQSQKMDAVGQLTGGVAHDFNNVLAVIISNLEIAEAKLEGNEQLRECLHDASTAAFHAASLTQRLLALSRKQALTPQLLVTGELLEEMRNLFERTLGEQIRVTIEGCEDLRPCVADRTQLESAILNLAINARDAMPEGGELVIQGSNVDLDEAHATEHPESKPGSYVQICVRDTGSGIPAEMLSRVFEPFFTTKEVGTGTGLGLSMVYGFAKQSGGHLTIESDAGGGTEVRLYLPSAIAQAPILEAEEDQETPQGCGETVLVVEDESAVRKLMTKILGALGYEVIVAADGPEAIALLGGIESLDLLLSDVVLPGGYSGAELAVEIARQRPETRVLFMSGYAPELILGDCSLEPDTQLLHKPFRTAELARAVRTALDS